MARTEHARWWRCRSRIQLPRLSIALIPNGVVGVPGPIMLAAM